MRPKATFTITPQLPSELAPLRELAMNLYFSWDHLVWDLFRRLDRELWDETMHNPVRMLGTISQKKLDEASRNEGFLAQMQRAYEHYRDYMDEPRWFQKQYRDLQDLKIAYFSAEYGLTECLPIYSGGLGVLSGDHLKTASDLGIPLVGVGLLYRNGYFHQFLNSDGWQQERYEDLDFYRLPLEPERGPDGGPLEINVPCLLRPVKARVWRVQVGRVSLFLLDTNVESNHPEDRAITGQLYGGDREMRIRQEIVLGIGGYLALTALGIEPDICHMNEGHSAFLSLERARQFMEKHGLNLFTSSLTASAGNCFTTHTPVPAGNDVFLPELMERYFREVAGKLGLPWERFLALGRQNPNDPSEPFGMTVLALRTSRRRNGVSELHGEVSREMWQGMWPQVPVGEIPIGSITNGVHIFSWISPELGLLFDRYLGPEWRSAPQKPEVWENVRNIPDEELWRTHERRRERLVAFAREALTRQYRNRGASASDCAWAKEILDPEALTIGFARRFATYKRATLLFSDIERLKALVEKHNVQFVFAGKSHPADNHGKEFIRNIFHTIREEPLRHRFVFIEDYEMGIARNMVQGCDIWLNNPRRPLEASGTSGMKASVNGCLHLSVLDGWWVEGYNETNGWIIGNGEVYPDADYQDRVESDSLYQVLEDEIIPTFSERGRAGVPRLWVQRMKSAIATIAPQFCAHRMLEEYTRLSYVPAAHAYRNLRRDSFRNAQELANWRTHVDSAWEQVRIADVKVTVTDTAGAPITGNTASVKVGDTIHVTATIRLGSLTSRDLLVECYHGYVNNEGLIENGTAERMELQTTDQAQTAVFCASFTCTTSGRYGCTVRVFPYHPSLSGKYETFHIRWA